MFRSRFIEIQADSRCAGVPADGGVLCLPFSVALSSFVAAEVAVTQVWFGLSATTTWLCLGIESSFFYLTVVYCLEMLFAISEGRFLLMNFRL